MDSVFSFHICFVKHWFINLKELDCVHVFLDDNLECRVGMLDVRFVPDVKNNLISVGMSDARGYSIKVDNGKMKAIKCSLVMLKVVKKFVLYILEGCSSASAVINKIEDNFDLA